MLFYFYIPAFILALVLISWAGSRLVRSLTVIAGVLGASEYFVAFILMSFATSVPELFVGVSAAIDNVPSFSLGNVIGANFINATLVMGVLAILSGGLLFESKISQKNFLLVFGIACLPIVLAIDGTVSRLDGFFLLAVFVFYLINLIREKEYFSKSLEGVKINREVTKDFFSSIAYFFVGIAALLAGSAFLVWSGKTIASALGFSNFFFGLIFVAIGTTLPELAFGVKAFFLKHESMAIGNTAGSIAFNSAFIIGVVSVLNPIHTKDTDLLLLSSIFLFVALLLLNFFAYTRSIISRREGVMLIVFYLLFVFAQLISW